MTTDRKKPGVTFWATVVVVAGMVAYPLSFGPACWLTSRTGLGTHALPTVYRPLVVIMARHIPSESSRIESVGGGGRLFSYPDAGFYPAKGLIEGYACLCAPKEWRWRCSADFAYRHGRVVRSSDDVWEWCDATKY